MLQDYLWGGHLTHIRTRVAWGDCCVKLKNVGLSLTDPEAATRSFLVKWVVKALGREHTNLHILLKF